MHVLTITVRASRTLCSAHARVYSTCASVHSAGVRGAGLEVGGEHARAWAQLRGEPGAEARVQAGEEEEEDHARLGRREEGGGSSA